MKHYQWLILSFVLIVSTAQAQTYDPCLKQNAFKSDGECWNSLTKVAKSNVVRGIWTGRSTRLRTHK